MTNSLSDIEAKILNHTRPNDDEFTLIFNHMISGNMEDGSIANVLTALEDMGIGASELSIGAAALRSCMSAVSAPIGTMDIVGTGGDGLSTYNISTACCFVVAGAGVPVAKHGNRAVSSKSGASDVLRSLGVELALSIAQTEACIDRVNVSFLFAPNHHKAMGHVAKARQMLGTRTIFNRLGPLCNPANVQYLLLGVFQDELRGLYANALAKLGTKRALIVHGGDGMDEITTTASTMISELNDGEITQYQIKPEDYGLPRATLADLEGGDPAENAIALRNLLLGERSAYRDIALLNSGAALYTAGRVDTISDGVIMAAKSIDSGAAFIALERLIAQTNHKGTPS